MKDNMKKYRYDSSKTAEAIVILHGVCRNSKHMSYIADSLQVLGYRVHNIDYKCRYQGAGKIVRDSSIQVKHIAKGYNKLHFVGHSLGGLIIRGILTAYMPINLGKVIQIAPPNQGSELANILQNRWLYKKIYGKVSQDLIPNSSFLNSLEQAPSYELGIIAGNSFNLLVNCLLKFKRNDCRVAIEETFLDSAKDHVVININHNQIVRSRETLKQIRNFLIDGVFEHENRTSKNIILKE